MQVTTLRLIFAILKAVKHFKAVEQKPIYLLGYNYFKINFKAVE
jgi:hypothetical protein